MTVVLRDTADDRLAGGKAMGRDVIRALGFQPGFTHMEWYRSMTARLCSARSAPDRPAPGPLT